jgi:hypothetical protein
MKVKILAVVTVLLMIGIFVMPVSAQELTNDVIFLRIGYVPISVVSFDKGVSGDVVSPTLEIGDNESTGFAFVGEYNLNLSPVLLSFGLEYQRMSTEGKIGTDEYSTHVNQFIMPLITVKYMTAGGFYIGAGLAGKWMIATEEFTTGNDPEKYSWEKKMDLWANAVIGYIFPISDGIYLDLQGRVGYNITGNQYSEFTWTNEKYKLSPQSEYDVAVYVGVGFKSFATGL